MSNLLEETLGGIVTDAVNGKLEALNINELINKQLEAVTQNMVKTVEIKRIDGTTKNIGAVHKQFQELLEYVNAKENVLLFGGAGVGKTSSVVKLADALGLEFRSVSFSSQTTQSNLIGFINANGDYVPTSLVECARLGKIALLDEFDAGESGVLLVINSLIDNGFIDTPDGLVFTHEDFRVVACANTDLNGASAKYNGRKQLDFATQDRFVAIDYGFDEDLVKLYTNNTPLFDLIMKIKEDVEIAIDGYNLTPRVFYKTANLLKNTSQPLDKILNATLFKGIDDDGRTIMQNVIDDNTKLVTMIEANRKNVAVVTEDATEPTIDDVVIPEPKEVIVDVVADNDDEPTIDDMLGDWE